MKFVLFLLLAMLSFVGAVAGGLAATGNLNGAALAHLAGRAPTDAAAKSGEGTKDAAGATSALPALPEVAPGHAGGSESATPDPLAAAAMQLKKREDDLKKREAQLDEREKQIAQREMALQKMRGELDTVQQQVATAVTAGDQDKQARLKSIALTLESMKADKAAKTIEGMPVEEAAQILGLMKEKSRGKVMEGMQPELATRLLRALQENPV